MKKAERSLIIRKMASLGTLQMQRNGGNINTHFPWFDDARSIRFAMSTDGVNPFGNLSSTHSTCLSCCHCTTFHPGYARNRNIWCW
jgi:hypothetical protein